MKRRPSFEETDTGTSTGKDPELPKPDNAGDNSKPEPVATIQVTNLMVSLHNKAIEEAQKINPDFSIFNTMADGDGKKGTFYGGGDHIIMVIPSTEDGFKNPDFKTIAVDMIKTYTQWFCGPDEANKVKLDSVFAHMIEKSEDEKKKDEDEEDEKKEDEDKDLEDTGDDDEDDKGKDKDKPDKGGKPDGGGPSESLVVDNLVHLLFETTQEEDEEIAKEQGMKIDGYYIQYKAEVGDKKSTIDKSWKRLAKISGKLLGKILGLSGGFGIRFFNGGAIKFGDVGNAIKKKVNKLKNLNKIDKDKIQAKIQQSLSIKYPKLNHQVAVKTSKEIQEEYRDRLSKGDYDAIGKSTFCLTVFFDTNSLGYKNITKQKLADMATKSMSASLLDKTLRLHKITADDIILLNNVGNKDEQGVEKTRSSNISTSQSATGETKKRGRGRPKKKRDWANSSMNYIIPNGIMNVLFETDNKINYNLLFEEGNKNDDDFGGDGESDSPDNDNVIEKSKVLEDIGNLASKLKSGTLSIFQSVEENHVRSGVFESEKFLESAKKSDTLSKITNQIDNNKSKYIVATSIRFNAKQLEDKTLLKESLMRGNLVSEDYSIIQIGKSDKYSSKVADAMEGVLKKIFGDGALYHIYRTYVKHKDKKGFRVIYVYSG